MIDLGDSEISIRQFSSEDVAALHLAAAASVAEAYPWLPWCRPGYSYEEALSWISSRALRWKEGAEYSFAVILRDTGELVGGCGFSQHNSFHRNANLGYWTRSQYTKRKIASRAAYYVAQFGFDQLILQRIEIIAAVENVASQRVALRIGAVREGIQRNKLLLHNKIHDAVCFSIIPSDLRLPSW